jgi:hypothetical protein
MRLLKQWTNDLDGDGKSLTTVAGED